VNVLGQGGDGIDEVQDEGVALAFAHALDFAGAGVTVTLDVANDRYLVTIPAGGGVSDHALLTNLPAASSGHSGFGVLADAQTWAALQTFGAGIKLAAAQQIQDSGGTGRILLATASPEVSITGDLDISDQLAVGGQASITANSVITLSENFSLGLFGVGAGLKDTIKAIGTGTNTFGPRAIDLIASAEQTGGNCLTVTGMLFTAKHNQAYPTATLRAFELACQTVGAGTLDDMQALRISVSGAGDAPDTAYHINLLASTVAATTMWGIHVGNISAAGQTTCVGVDIDALTGATTNIGLRLNANCMELAERTAPAAPAANGCRLYAVDNGAGKTQLMALFSSGAAQQVAIQP